MDLYLIRHAEAVPRETAEVADDWGRPLTDDGRDQARRLGALLARRELRLGAVVTSPLLRARETTAALLAELPEPRPAVAVFDEIGGDMRPMRVLSYLERLNQETVAIVGHEPILGQFLAWLIGSKKARLEMAKAGMACVSLEALEKGAGLLRWLVTPEWF